MWMRPQNRRSRISSSITTAVYWSLIRDDARPRNSVVQVPAPATRNLTDKCVFPIRIGVRPDGVLCLLCNTMRPDLSELWILSIYLIPLLEGEDK